MRYNGKAVGDMPFFQTDDMQHCVLVIYTLKRDGMQGYALMNP